MLKTKKLNLSKVISNILPMSGYTKTGGGK
jgi:hypothetical protein